jgi:hypothetical protein
VSLAGVLSEDEFRQLILAIDPQKSDREVAQMLVDADPHSLRLITFSQVRLSLSSSSVRPSSWSNAGSLSVSVSTSWRPSWCSWLVHSEERQRALPSKHA